MYFSELLHCFTYMCPTGRLQLVQDVVLARVLDDATFSTLNSLYYFNTVALVTDLQADKKYIISM